MANVLRDQTALLDWLGDLVIGHVLEMVVRHDDGCPTLRTDDAFGRDCACRPEYAIERVDGGR